MAQLPSIPAIGNDLASHTAALTQIRNILIGIQAAGGQAGAPVQQKQNATLAALIADTLKLNKAVGTPAGGQVGAGDTVWTALAFIGGNNWGQTAQGGAETSQFRKTPEGRVTVIVNVDSSAPNNANAVGPLPAGYRPAATLFFNGNNKAGVMIEVEIHSDGKIYPNKAGLVNLTSVGTYEFYAEQ